MPTLLALLTYEQHKHNWCETKDNNRRTNLNTVNSRLTFKVQSPSRVAGAVAEATRHPQLYCGFNGILSPALLRYCHLLYSTVTLRLPREDTMSDVAGFW